MSQPITVGNVIIAVAGKNVRVFFTSLVEKSVYASHSRSQCPISSSNLHMVASINSQYRCW